MEDVRIIKSYVWHGDDCFFISSIERDSSAICEPPPIRFYETIIWKWDWTKKERGELVWSNGGIHTLEQHFLMATALRAGGVEGLD